MKYKSKTLQEQGRKNNNILERERTPGCDYNSTLGR